MESDSLSKNITKQIVKECKIIGTTVDETFVYNFVKLLQLDPRWGISSEQLTNKTVVQKFVGHCVETLKQELSPSLVILKMQVYFKTSFLSRDEIVEKNRAGLATRLAPLEQEILKVHNVSIEHDFEKFYKRVVYYVTLLSGLGNPALHSVYKEAHAALLSIFSRQEAEDFICQSRASRQEQLMDLTKLVTGVRLFNRDCKKGGHGIENLPKLIAWATEAINGDLQKVLLFVMERVNMMTTVVDKCYVIKENEYGYYVTSEIPPESFGEADLEYYKDLLLLYRQYELYIRKIIDEVHNISTIVPETIDQLEDILNEIHHTVRYHTAVPVEQVYPLFCRLADEWTALQDIAILLAKQNQILFTLQSYSSQLSVDEHLLKSVLGPEGALSDADRLKKTSSSSLYKFKTDEFVDVLDPRAIEDFDSSSLEYMGFCAYKLVETNGCLIPGNPNLGVILYKNKFYAFSSEEAAKAWCTSPDDFLMRTLQLARYKIELVNFLQLQDELVEVQKIGELYSKPPLPVLKQEVETQTDVHPLDTNLVDEYVWNVWDMKRQAIYLANLLNCKSHSTQTDKSIKNAVKTQTQEQRDKLLQTKKDNYSSVPKLSHFIYGLRGRLDDKQFAITLTRPVKE